MSRDEPMKDARPAMSAEDPKPVAFLKEWMDGGAERFRVDLKATHEPWLEVYNPKITPLYRRANPPPAAGEFVLVPREPTKKMCEAAYGLLASKKIWAAMISAAPVPPAAGETEDITDWETAYRASEADGLFAAAPVPPAAPSTMREEIAKIIDPWSWKQCQWATEQDNDEVLKKFLPARELSLARADAILALTEARVTALEGERDEALKRAAPYMHSRLISAEAALQSATQQRDGLVKALEEIASGTWNDGRAAINALTYMQFAREALRASAPKGEEG